MTRSLLTKSAWLPFSVSVFIFLSCQNPSTPVTENFTYPLTVGNSWQYSRSYFATNYMIAVNDSVFVPKDTQLSFGTSIEFVSVEREDSLSLPIRTVVMRDSSVVQGNAASAVGRGWYCNSANGLLKYAIDYPGGPQANPKIATVRSGSGLPPSGGMQALLIQDFIQHLVKSLAQTALFISADTPNVCYRYPYGSGDVWDFKTGVSDSLRVEKKYLPKETITTPAGTFECFKIKWLRYLGLPGALDTATVVYEWVSPQYGLVKRTFTARDFVETVFDPNSLTTFRAVAKYDLVDEYVLSSVKVQ